MNSRMILTAITGIAAMLSQVAVGQDFDPNDVVARRLKEGLPILDLEVPNAPDWMTTHKYRQKSFTFVRLRYGSAGGQTPKRRSLWATDYPDADLNLALLFGKLTALDVSTPSLVLDITDPKLKDYPFAYMAEPGSLAATEAEVEALRKYLLNGGFLMVDDSWGDREWENVAGVMKKLFPNRVPVELTAKHRLFHCAFEINQKPQVPSIHHFVTTGNTIERPGENEAHFRAIFNDTNRMMVLMCHNTDLADGWERVGADKRYTEEVSMKLAFPMGINVLFYAMNQK